MISHWNNLTKSVSVTLHWVHYSIENVTTLTNDVSVTIKTDKEFESLTVESQIITCR